MKKNWKIIVGLILALIVIVFAMLNMEVATINFGFVQVKQPLIILIVASTLLGAIIVALFSSATLFNRNREIKSLKKELAQMKQETQQKIDQAVEQERTVLTKELTNNNEGQEDAENAISESK